MTKYLWVASASASVPEVDGRRGERVDEPIAMGGTGTPAIAGRLGEVEAEVDIADTVG